MVRKASLGRQVGRRGALLGLALWSSSAVAAAAGTVDVSGFSNVTFSNLDPSVSASSSQSICLFTDTSRYSVTATGSGAGSAFTLSAGGAVAPLPYSVAWSSTAFQIGGVTLNPAAPLTGLTSLATSLTCLVGLGASASLTVSLASSDLQTALAGVSYTGVLTLTVTAQ